MFTKGLRERGELCAIFKALEETLWDARKPHLRADEVGEIVAFGPGQL